MNCLDLISQIRECEARIDELQSDPRCSLAEFRAMAEQSYPVVPTELKRIGKELKRQRFAPVAEIVAEIVGYWHREHILMGPGIPPVELERMVNPSQHVRRILALGLLQCSLEDLVTYAAGIFVPNPGQLSEADQAERGKQIGELVTARAELCSRLAEAARAEAVLDENTGAEVVMWTQPPPRPVVPLDGLLGDVWLSEHDRREKLRAHWETVWRNCKPVALLPEHSLPARLLEWHSKYYADLELTRKKAA